MRITLVAERLAYPLDEGIKNMTLNLLAALRREHAVQALTVFGQDMPDRGVRDVRSNKAFVGCELLSEMREFAPEGLLYVPTACATLGSFVRGRALSWQCGAPLALLALQVREYGALARKAMPMLSPECILVQAQRTAQSLVALGDPVAGRVRTLPPAVDLDRFSPASDAERGELRERWGVPQEAFVLLHVGHLNAGRGLRDLLMVSRRPDEQLVVVGSSSTPHDPRLVAELRAQGVRVVDHAVDEIAEVYRLADCYLFPVRGEVSSIDMPLSVLEAMACGLPVISRPFGALPQTFGEAPGIWFTPGGDDMRRCLDQVRGGEPLATRELVREYTWDNLARAVLREAFGGSV